MLMLSTNGSQYCHAWPNIEWEKMDEAASIWRRFCRNTTIPAVGFISREIKLNRLLWVLCFLGGIAGTVAITLTILEDSRSESMYINIEAPVPITEIQFPGIAICEINKISKHRAVELANKLSTVSNLGRDKLLNMTRLLGNLYDYSNVGAEDLQTLQDLLDQLDGGTSDEDMIRRLASLVTPCEDLLHNCTWNSISYSCTDLFQMRFTDSGLCCVFNYVRDTPEAAFLSSGNKAAVTGPIRKFMGAGAARGLSVSIVNNLSDYFYTSMASRGALLKLFLPTDFADMPSGSLKSKWLRYYPLDDPRAVELSFEFEDSLLCENCLPNCADTLYDTSTSYLEFHSGSDYLNSSRVHVFSGNGQAKYYKKRVATMWFESLSTVGGILSFIMGISIINLVELAVVCAKLWGSVDVLLEFLEVAIHTAVYLRQLYPESIFVARKKYGVAVFQAVHPEVAKYIQECLKAAGFHASKKQLKRLLVCFEADDIVADRYSVSKLL
uniref:HORMA domain-containing protein n=1 Tax=Dendroctonus ponderosae TaxID=77166 RepID=A0AAR5P4F9_DENPD